MEHLTGTKGAVGAGLLVLPLATGNAIASRQSLKLLLLPRTSILMKGFVAVIFRVVREVLTNTQKKEGFASSLDVKVAE